MELLVCFSDLGIWIVIKHRPEDTESLGCGESTSYLLMHLPPVPLSSITPFVPVTLSFCKDVFFLCVKLEATTTCRCFGLVFGGGAFKASITSWPFGLHGGCTKFHHETPPMSGGIEVLDLWRDPNRISWWDKEPQRCPGSMSWKIVVAAWLKGMHGDT